MPPHRFAQAAEIKPPSNTMVNSAVPPLPAHPSFTVPTADDAPAVQINHLTFKYEDQTVIHDVSMDLHAGSRVLLVGGNGAGKSTLLRIMAGKHIHDDSAVFVLGQNSFRSTALNYRRQYMDADWGLRTVAFAGTGVSYQADIPVSGMMVKLQEEFPERRDYLIELLGIDMDWRMHKVSDGQRRRVQMFLGLLRPFEVLFLDEVTAVLDLLCRQDLLGFLKHETETRKCTIVYATHIFDGLDTWATHVVQVRTSTPEFPSGTVGYHGELEGIPKFQELKAANVPSPLMGLVEFWLREEHAARKAANWSNKERQSGRGTEGETKAGDAQTSGGGYTSGRLLTTSTREGGGFDAGQRHNYW
jgi:CCR4-NOT complex subunit CAF16